MDLGFRKVNSYGFPFRWRSEGERLRVVDDSAPGDGEGESHVHEANHCGWICPSLGFRLPLET